MATKTDVSRDILRHIRVIDPDEAPPAADDQDTKSVIDGVHAQLLNDGIAYWDVDDFPEHVRWPFVRYVAPIVASQFGVSAQRMQRLMGDSVQAYRDLVSQTRLEDNTGLPTRADYY